jgi:CMP-N-acetylneuraminic acid synthetase
MEFFVNDMKNLPLVVEKRLSELRQMDAQSSAMLKSNAAEEAQLFDDVATLAKSDPDFDESPVLERFSKIQNRRHDTLAAVEEQMKKIQKLYDLVDGRLTYIGREPYYTTT